MSVDSQIDVMSSVTDVALAKYAGTPISLDSIAQNRKQGIAAIKTTECFQELAHEAWPTYLVVLPTHMPDPVRKLGGELGRGSRARMGAFSVLPPGRPGHWATEHGRTFETVKLLFTREFLLNTARDVFGDKTENVELPDIHTGSDPFLVQVMSQIATELVSKNGLSDLYLESVSHLLVHHLVRHHSTLTQLSERAGPSLNRRAIDRTLDFIEEHLDETITIDAMADVAGFSAFHFLRGFKAEMGDTPHRYVMSRRVERCRELLSSTDEPLAHIAYACGFSSQAHMTTVFRESVGVTPGDYRRKVSD
ncbi:MAG: AraC family transcriptional regulator [Pseudomonadota bacterium]